jgi:hypothetical protein
MDVAAAVERERAFGLYHLYPCRVPHISLVFREMWDTTGLALKPRWAPNHSLSFQTLRFATKENTNFARRNPGLKCETWATHSKAHSLATSSPSTKRPYRLQRINVSPTKLFRVAFPLAGKPSLTFL